MTDAAPLLAVTEAVSSLPTVPRGTRQLQDALLPRKSLPARRSRVGPTRAEQLTRALLTPAPVLVRTVAAAVNRLPAVGVLGLVASLVTTSLFVREDGAGGGGGGGEGGGGDGAGGAGGGDGDAGVVDGAGSTPR